MFACVRRTHSSVVRTFILVNESPEYMVRREPDLAEGLYAMVHSPALVCAHSVSVSECPGVTVPLWVS